MHLFALSSCLILGTLAARGKYILQRMLSLSQGTLIIYRVVAKIT